MTSWAYNSLITGVTITFIGIKRLKINSTGVRLVGISDQQSLFSTCEPSRRWARAPIGSCTDSTKWGRGCQSCNSTRNFDHWWWKNSWGSKDKLDLSLLPERISGNNLSTSIKGVYKFLIIYSSPLIPVALSVMIKVSVPLYSGDLNIGLVW